MKIVFVDPSGSFKEGKGRTGIAVLTDNNWSSLELAEMAAKNYESRYAYWNDLIFKIADYHPDLVVIESFMIRTMGFLTGKMPETIQFIGCLTHYLDGCDIKWITQTPSAAKSRFKDEDLPRYIPGFEKIVDDSGNVRFYFNGKRTNDHIRDALKHLLYFKKYKEVKLYGREGNPI